MTASVLTEEHVRLLEIAQPLCLRLALALAGPDALRAHGLEPDLPTRANGPGNGSGSGNGLVLVTAEGPPLADIAAGLAETFRTAGLPVHEQPGTPRRIQLAGAPCPIEVRKEPLRHAPLLLGAPVPVVALEDAAALAVLALCDRALLTDLAAVHALTARFREGELLALAAAADEDFDARTLADRLEAAAQSADDRVRSWAERWSQDLRLDLLETQELADGLHDPYLEDPDLEDPDRDGEDDR